MDGHYNINYCIALSRVIALFLCYALFVLYIYFAPCLDHHSVMSLFRAIEAVTLPHL